MSLRQVSCYATATNILEKTDAELQRLVELGLTLLYIGPESGDEATMRRIAKGPRPEGASRDDAYLFDAHVAAAHKAKAAGFRISTIFLLGAGGIARILHAEARRTHHQMDPDYLGAHADRGLGHTAGAHPGQHYDAAGGASVVGELRTMVAESRQRRRRFGPTTRQLPASRRDLPDDVIIVDPPDLALSGAIPLRPEWSRGL